MLIKNFDELLSHSPEELLNARRDALEILMETMEKIDAYRVTKSSLSMKDVILSVAGEEIDLSRFENIYVVGFGKASIGMAKAVGEFLPVKEGIVISSGGGGGAEVAAEEKAGGEEYPESIGVLYGSHPLPTEENVRATEEILKIVEKARENDIIIILISGGGSSLLCMPRVSMESIREVTERLLRAGCTIKELNTVRKHVSYIKGGQFARMSRAVMVSLIISDVMDNPVEFIASGPTSPDSTTYEDARDILLKYDLWGCIGEVEDVIKEGIEGKIEDTPEELDNVRNIIIAGNVTACDEAGKAASRKGYYSKVVGASVSGEARDAGADIARYAKILPRGKAALIFGGETTVTVEGNGMGGRNQEIVLGAIKEIENERIVILSCGTDGIDGNSDAAGAVGDGMSLRRARELGMDADDYLRNNDSYQFFKKLGDLIITGQTGTNVMDIQIVIKY